jgi:sortase A
MRPRLNILEWFLLLFGLLALDCFIWINTSTLFYQAYADWAFDETLRGLQPSISGFAADEIAWLIRGAKTGALAQENAETQEPIPSAKAPLPDRLIGRMRIPRLRVAVMVREGADEHTLRRAVGHIPGTGLPGTTGNVALAGHRDSFFRELRNIRKDDKIELQTGQDTYRYAVRSVEVVSPKDVQVLKASGGETLTLVTCYPFSYVGSAPKRFIVRAARVGTSPRPLPRRGSSV